MDYNFKEIEKKWQDKWYSENTFAAKNDFTLPKFYALVEFPYPSGQGLHVGHPRSYTALDIVARQKRLTGREKSPPPTKHTTNGPSGFFCSCLKKAWLISRKCPLTGAPAARLAWQTKKLLTAFASAAAARLCSGTNRSGC